MAKSQHIGSANNFGPALRAARKWRGLAQEEFDVVSGRTYVSAIERGLKDPTLSKIDQLAQVLTLHPLTLLSLAYASPLNDGAVPIEQLLTRVKTELVSLVQGRQT